jgi:heterodisulfide reductase subunit C
MPLAETIKPESAFADQVVALAGEGFRLCFQCGKCSSGCPVSFAMDHPPHHIIRMVQYGLRGAVLSSATIWVCASCQTCTTRCPNDVDLAHVMDCLRQLALEAGVRVAEPNIARFHRCFLDSVAAHGRVHELSMIGRYKLKTGGLLGDARRSWRQWRQGKLGLAESLTSSDAFAEMRQGLDMVRRGKLHLLPPRKVRGFGALKRVFADARRRG